MPDTTADDLRTILLHAERQRTDDLIERVDNLEQQVNDKEALIELLMPVLSEVLRQKIHDARAEMIELLYPIIGEVVMRAVSESMRDLMRRVDTQMRQALTPAWCGNVYARLHGVSEGERLLREALPFTVVEVFLVQRPSGLLLRYVSSQPAEVRDSDVISGMLTAIRDFTQDAFSGHATGELDEIQYGTLRIVIEAARYAYLAVVVDGIEPPVFMPRCALLIEIQGQYEERLRDFDGDASFLAPIDAQLRTLLAPVPPPPASPQGLTPGQRRVLIGAAAVLLLCLVLTCLTTRGNPVGQQPGAAGDHL
ncbi:MAG: hypothetical protein HZY76_12620 [Anaerolineae bacterium]|nr:MAG: hypothetical protein HZY76_12620 [Anaerolineae bacterium]